MIICDIEIGLDDFQIIIKLFLDVGVDLNLQDNRGLIVFYLVIMYDFYFVELIGLLFFFCQNIDFEVKSQIGDNFLYFFFNKLLCEENVV